MNEILTEFQILEMARQFLRLIYLHDREFAIVSVDNLAVKITKEAIVEAEVLDLISAKIDYHPPKEVAQYIREFHQESHQESPLKNSEFTAH